MVNRFQATSTLDKFFEGGIILKGLSGLLEFIGGLLLLFVTPEEIHSFLSWVTQRELIEDPHDKVATVLLQSGSHLTSGGRAFIIAYLWIHAAVKIIAVGGILLNKLWAYPFSLITLGLLMLYQVYSILFVKVSISMVLLTIFDVVILVLIWFEYQKMKKKLNPA